MRNNTLWHTITVDEAADALGADMKNGLTGREAEARLAAHGPNSLKETKRVTPLAMFLGQFRDFMIIVLMVAAIVSGIVGDVTDTIAIVVIVVMNAVIGFVQEYRADKAMEALKLMASPRVRVLRDGRERVIPETGVVPGDVVLLEAGEVVPADIRLFEAARLKADESAITGESVPAEKSTAPVADAGAAVGDRLCIVFKGTVISYGRGAGLAVATGMEAELGRIAGLIQGGEDTKTPLQKRLAVFGRKLSFAIFAVCAVVFAAGLLRGEEPVLMFLTAVSLVVAAIPEALPAVITISLALGAKKMVAKNALIRKLPAVETLGSVTYVCTDKTGTLTMNRMTVGEFRAGGGLCVAAEAGDGGPADFLLKCMALSNDARRDADGAVTGDPTEAALYVSASEKGYDRAALEKTYPRVAEVPFDSGRKLMTTIHEDPSGGYLVITKGALEVVLDISVDALDAEGPGSLGRDTVRSDGERAAAAGYRVLAFGYRRLDEMSADVGPEVESGLTFAGFVGLLDPPREGVWQAIAECRTAGVRVVMITGDHPVTASRIAHELGIDGGPQDVMTGTTLGKLSDEELAARAGGVKVYARVAPEQKLKIVQALQSRGEFVAMTGDGVNDAPALKRADIGVSMGVCGTEVAKESSDMVLLDDDFATIVRAIREGRRIYDNIRKFIRYSLAGNSGQIWALFLAPFFGLPLPLLPVQILWINLVTDGLPGLSLAAEPEEKGIMERPPRHPEESIFAQGLGAQALWSGFLMAAVAISLQAWAYTSGNPNWQSMVFTVICLSKVFNVMAVRSETESVFRQGLSSNKPLLLSVILTFTLQMATLYVPFLNPIFRTRPLGTAELALVLGLSCSVFVAVEAGKALKRKNNATRSGPALNA
ncbi:MAG: cation-translocating P-type ATPase [Nitrospirae bacterium]|nr:cation-translocating P-type ATPase [Nitrospirota bacterium]